MNQAAAGTQQYRRRFPAMAVRALNAKTHAARRIRAVPATRPAQPAPAVPLTQLVALPDSQHGTGWLLDVRAADTDGAITLADAAAAWGWGPGTHLRVRVADATVTVSGATGAGTAVRLDGRGRLRLPLAWRRLHGVEGVGRVAVLTGPAHHHPLVQIQPAGLAAHRISTALTSPDLAPPTPVR
jgi:hypothetical protein